MGAAARKPLEAPGTPVKRQGHFPCEGEIARRLSQSEDRWRALARNLEAQYPDFPRKDPLMGGRYFPAVEAFFARRAGLVTIQEVTADEAAKENLSAL